MQCVGAQELGERDADAVEHRITTGQYTDPGIGMRAQQADECGQQR